MCCTSVVTSKMESVSNFLINFIIGKRFRKFFFKFNMLLHIDAILGLILLMVTFSLFKVNCICANAT